MKRQPIFLLTILLIGIAPIFLCPLPSVQAQSNTVLQVASVERAPFVVERGTGYIGYSIELWDEIAKELGVEYRLTVYDTFPEMLDKVKQKEADLAIANITITAEREAQMDFSHPIYLSGLQILVARSNPSGIGQLVRSIVASGLLWVIGGALLVLLLVAHLIWFFETGDEREFHDTYQEGIWDAFWWAAVTVTTVGYGDKVPRSKSGRAVALLWMFFSLFLLSVFVAQTSNILADSVFRADIEGPSDLPGYKVATIGGSTADSYLVTAGVTDIIRYDTPQEMFSGLEAGAANAVVFDAPVLAYYEAQAERGKVKLVGPIFKREQFGIALQQDSPYREQVNQALLKLAEDGRTETIYDRWFSPLD